MDYKYIEQLLECYFNCQTTLQEEQILRSFFAQEDVPVHLLQYADLFQYEAEAKEDVLGEEFDQRMMAQIRNNEAKESQEQEEKPRTIKRFTHHFAPFFKAAAVVAIALTIGRAAEHAIGEHAAEDNANVIALDPYIKSEDILQTIRGKDVSQAELKATNDTLMTQPTTEQMQ